MSEKKRESYLSDLQNIKLDWNTKYNVIDTHNFVINFGIHDDEWFDSYEFSLQLKLLKKIQDDFIVLHALVDDNIMDALLDDTKNGLNWPKIRKQSLKILKQIDWEEEDLSEPFFSLKEMLELRIDFELACIEEAIKLMRK